MEEIGKTNLAESMEESGKQFVGESVNEIRWNVMKRSNWEDRL